MAPPLDTRSRPEMHRTALHSSGILSTSFVDYMYHFVLLEFDRVYRAPPITCIYYSDKENLYTKEQGEEIFALDLFHGRGPIVDVRNRRWSLCI